MLQILGAACSAGGPGKGCHLAPEYLEAAFAFSEKPVAGVHYAGTVVESFAKHNNAQGIVNDFCHALNAQDMVGELHQKMIERYPLRGKIKSFMLRTLL